MSGYRWDASDYNRNSAMQERFAVDLLQRISLRGDEHVLDIGSGDGKVTARIASMVPRGAVIGIDASTDMVRFAAESYSPLTHPNLRFTVQDASQLQYASEFDLVVSFSALHWVIDHRPLLAGIARSLKPGGRLLAQFGGKGNMGVLEELAIAIPTEMRWQKYFQGFTYPWGFYSPDEYRPWLDAAGLRPTHLTLETRDVVHRGREGWTAWIRTAWPSYVNRIPNEYRDDFLADLGDRYFAICPLDENGNAHVRMMRLEVDAVKPLA